MSTTHKIHEGTETIAMRTLADVKRRAVVGTRLEVLEHWYMEPGSIRTVTKVRAGGLDVDSSHDPGKRFVQEWPKAKDVIEITDDEIAYNIVVYPASGRHVHKFEPVTRGICRLRFLD